MKNKVKIIAEIGVNHNGSLELAKKLILKCKKAGVDYVKFQSYITEELVNKKATLANYQKKNRFRNQFELLKKYEMSLPFQKNIIKFCKKKKIKFLSTPFDLKSLYFLKKYVDFVKISSTDTQNYQILSEAVKIKKKIILSTGMSSYQEISNSLRFLFKKGLIKKNLCILHCVSDYPARIEDLNLNSILYLKKKFSVDVGYSDHSPGFEAAIIAVSLGAKFIEKHVTLNKSLEGPDHKASLEVSELPSFVQSIRKAEKAMGKIKKILSKAELTNKKVLRRSIVASKKIKKGQIFTLQNITTKRPSHGLSPTNWFKILGKKSKKNYSKDDFI